MADHSLCDIVLKFTLHEHSRFIWELAITNPGNLQMKKGRESRAPEKWTPRNDSPR